MMFAECSLVKLGVNALLFFTELLEKVWSRALMAAGLLLALTGLVGLVQHRSQAWLYFSVSLTAAGIGLGLPVVAYLAAGASRRKLGATMGSLAAAAGLGQALGSSVAGWSFGVMGQHTFAWLTLPLLTLLVFLLARPDWWLVSATPIHSDAFTTMNLASTALLALAMSTDAFAAAVGKGSALQKPRWREALRTGGIFGTIEAVTPIIGWMLGSVAARYVTAWDHWIAFVLLGVLGLRMVRAGIKVSEQDNSPKPSRHSFWLLAMTGFATSIDAMAVGVGLAFLDVNIVPVAAAIGLTTFLMVTAGVMLGRVLGAVAGKRAEIVGGLLLIGIGAAILYEHLSAG